MATDLTAIRALARRLYADTAATGPALADADLTALINEVYFKWLEAVEPRYKTGTIFTVGSSAVSAVITPASVVEIGTLVAGTLGTTYKVLEVVDHAKIQAKYEEDGTTASDVPSMVALVRKQDDTEANMPYAWTLAVWPRSSAGYTVTGYYRVTPAALSSGTDEPDMNEESRYVLARVVAVRAASIIGEDPEFIASIAEPLSEQVRSAMGLTALYQRPNPNAQKRGV